MVRCRKRYFETVGVPLEIPLKAAEA